MILKLLYCSLAKWLIVTHHVNVNVEVLGSIPPFDILFILL